MKFGSAVALLSLLATMAGSNVSAQKVGLRGGSVEKNIGTKKQLPKDKDGKIAKPHQEVTRALNTGDCTDTPEGWYDSDGPTYNCAWYATYYQDAYACVQWGDGFQNFGVTANQACCACGGGQSQTPPPTPPPTLPPPPTPVPAPIAAPPPTPPLGGGNGAINTNDRAAVVQAFNSRYNAPEPNMVWTGNVENCVAGTTGVSFQQRVIDQINFYRNMAGIASANLDAQNTNFQKSALMMRANNEINHHPPTSWTCYSSEGAAGAGSSNLYHWVDQGVGRGHGVFAINNYMVDPGDVNTHAGHRRAILDPRRTQFATGDVPGVNSLAIWQGDASGDAAQTEFVAWPSKGYFPYQLLPYGGEWFMPYTGRWSFGVDGADFSNSQVAVTDVTAGRSYTADLEPIDNNRGSINTIVFKPRGFSYDKPTQDTRIRVDITGVLVNNETRNYSYEVIIIDP